MNINRVRTIIAIVASGLIAFAFFRWFEGARRLLLTAGTFFLVLVALLGLLSVHFDTSRVTVNVKVASGLFLVASLCSSVIFSLFDFRAPSYIIANGLLALCYALVINILVSKTD